MTFVVWVCLLVCLFVFPLIKLLAVQENRYKWFAKRAKDEEDDFCMSCHFPAHISRSEMLTFLPNLLSLHVDQAPCLFVSPNEHNFTFDGYWIDHCCHGLWWPFVFIVLPPSRLWGLFESAHVLFGVRFIGWGGKEEMLWGFRTGRTQCSLRSLHCHFSLYFLMGCSHMVPPEASVLTALFAGRTTLLWRVSSSARVRSSWSVAVSQT